MLLKDFKDKKITIFGLGLHGGGVGAAKFFAELEAKVLVTDLKNEEELKKSIEELKSFKIKYVLGQHRSEDFINADLIIKNPGVPDNSKYLEIARKNKVAIDTDIGIFFDYCPCPIIGVTGTKGKSTVATLIARFLKQKKSNVYLAGNIRTSVLSKLKKISKDDLVVLELSSWQLNGLKYHHKSPACAVITNIMPDHLNRYKNMEDYIGDKKEIFKWQKKGDYLILNYDDKIVREMAREVKKQRVIFYSQSEKPISNVGAYLHGEKVLFGEENKEICLLSDSKLLGQHNISNLLAAISVARLYDVSRKSIIRALADFTGAEGRLQLIKEINGVKYINDTTATTPEATIAAISSFPNGTRKKIILIAGGADKELDYTELAEKIIKKVKILVLFEGAATNKLNETIKKAFSENKTDIKILGPFNNMNTAVSTAEKNSEPGDIVLLSPAAASFGLFQHEFDRGEQFNQAVLYL